MTKELTDRDMDWILRIEELFKIFREQTKLNEVDVASVGHTINNIIISLSHLRDILGVDDCENIEAYSANCVYANRKWGDHDMCDPCKRSVAQQTRQQNALKVKAALRMIKDHYNADLDVK